jgi:hypothetical protein
LNSEIASPTFSIVGPIGRHHHDAGRKDCRVI